MTSVLHLSYEMRDRGKRKITVAVKNLIECTSGYSRSMIIDLMRVTSLKKEKIEINEPGRLEINALGLPYGLFLKQHLNRVYDFILRAEEKDLISFRNIDAIHAHKVTFEGYVGYLLHKRLNVPLILTLRGTDFTVFHYRPDLLSLYKNILKSAFKICYLVPSMITMLKKSLGKEFYEQYLKDKMVHLPNIIIRENMEQGIGTDAPYIFTALSFTKKDVKRKNLKNLLKAIAGIKHLDIHLKVAGSGEYDWKIRKWINDLHLQDKVELLGRVSNKDIDKYYASATAFCLPSVSESFGLVYAESLFNGTPILCSKGVVGFDGFFNNAGVSVDPDSVEEIRNGIIELIINNSFYRNEIKRLKNEGAFSIFSPEHISGIYKEMVSDINSFTKKELSF